MDRDTLRVCRHGRHCLRAGQSGEALYPNASPPADSSLVASGAVPPSITPPIRLGSEIARVCSERGIALIFDEVMVASAWRRGAQGILRRTRNLYYGSRSRWLACGRAVRWRELMKRFHDGPSADVCSHAAPSTRIRTLMGAMHAFLQRLRAGGARRYTGLDDRWNERAPR